MKSGGSHCRFLFFLVIAALIFGLGAGAALAQAPTKIGEFEWVSIGSGHPYLRDLGDSPREWTIRRPDATYIRVHFSQFDLAPGDYIEISDLSGNTVHRYEGRGPHGTGDFWAFTTPGDAAIVRLNATFGNGHGFEIDSFGRGFVDIFDLRSQSEPVFGAIDPGVSLDPAYAVESVCGTNDWDNVECYNSSNPTEREKARGAVKAIIGCCSSCTAFKASDSGQFMTNNHCTSTSSGVASTELQMEYKLSGCNSGSSGDSGSVFGSGLIATDYTLDYTLMGSTGNSSGIPCLNIDDRLASAGERIYIAGHPNGGVKKLSLESSHPSNPAGVCEVDGSPVNGRGTGTDIGYYCDTIGGSSGSPVLSGDTHNVVAIHHFGGCQNSGVRMDLIMNQISGDLDTCTGDPGDPGDPTCLSKGSSCTVGADCCSNKCKGKSGRKSCK